jgi:Cft2 family RNA processing exonuclease
MTTSITKVRTATVYRTKAREVIADFEKHAYNEADEPQFQMAVFADGTVAQRWLTSVGSHVWWDSLDDLYTIHIYAHPDYGTRVEWDDGTIDEL